MTDSLADEVRKAQAGDEKARDRILRWLEKYFPDDSGEIE
jgi:oligoribonuclease (3'-5' exoribonuclease)